MPADVRAFCDAALAAGPAAGASAATVFSAGAATLHSVAASAPSSVRPDVARLASALDALVARLGAARFDLASVDSAALGPVATKGLGDASAAAAAYARKTCAPLVATGRLSAHPPAPPGTVPVSIVIDRSAAAPGPAGSVSVREEIAGTPGGAPPCTTDFSLALASAARPCLSYVPAGAMTTLTAVANGAGAYEFTGWKGPCTGASVVCHFTATGDPTVTATFRPVPALVIEARGSGAATVTGPGASPARCPPSGSPAASTTPDYPSARCTFRYATGTAVRIEARAGSAGNAAVPRFAGWSGGCTGAAPGCTVTMPPSGTAVVAGFEYYWCPAASGGRAFPSIGGGLCAGGDPVRGPEVPPPGDAKICTGEAATRGLQALDHVVDVVVPAALAPSLNMALHQAISEAGERVIAARPGSGCAATP